MNGVQSKLDGIVTEFADLDGREKLELLVDFAKGLPPLSAEYEARKGSGESRVHECQTPVFLWTEVDGGVARLVAEVAPEAPTVKGFVALLAEAINGRPATEAAALPDDVLGMMRTRGLQAILARIRRGFAAAA